VNAGVCHKEYSKVEGAETGHVISTPTETEVAVMNEQAGGGNSQQRNNMQ
jgi:hypothetical protein